jgi:hypothetical protein
MDEWMTFLRSIENKTIPETSGGFLIPQNAKFRKAGIKAWFYRLIKDERGWETRNLHDEILRRVKEAKAIK